MSAAKPGEILGPYPNDAATEVYKVEAIEEPSDADIRASLVRERSIWIEPRYHEELLKKYKFTLDPDQVSPTIFAAVTELADSILASLGPDGTRAERGVRPALGVIARAGSDSITYRDLASPDLLPRASDGKGRISDTQSLYHLSVSAILPKLVLRDAHDRRIDQDPGVARVLRLIRESVSTQAMVSREVPPQNRPDSLRAYFESHSERYRRPPARRAVVAIFIKEDSARAARYFWSGKATFDSSLIAQRFRLQPGASATTLLPGYYAPMTLYETDRDSLSLVTRAVEPGNLTPVVGIRHGFAICLVLEKEPARALTFEEAADRVAVDYRADREEKWVLRELKRLRPITPVRRFPARLASLRLAAASGVEGGDR
ncbi:MAG: peptidyl-prolyl cis-trans isomerase [Candidatus Latescibacteria bacterium]|nr:peptidyl-prolyl cis-trans isomerase [Candidatus Latescibacterota bacterium]